MKKLIIVPTYNEKENIIQIITAIFQQSLGFDILVVDDNSPDGTSALVKELQAQYPENSEGGAPSLYILDRPGKQGLGKAYLHGFEWGISKGYEWLVEMDADFSHRPVDLKQLVEAMANYDFVVGSRYVQGGSTKNWGLLRKLISRGGSLYSRIILGYPLKDWTGGFNAWKAATLNGIGLEGVRSNGYSFQIELKYKALRRGFKGLEVPIIFEDRRVGQSKMSSRIVLEALYQVWFIRGM